MEQTWQSETTVRDGTSVVTPVRRTRHRRASPLADVLQAAITRAPRVQVDLARVNFIDSTVLNTFVNAHGHATDRGASVSDQLSDPESDGVSGIVSHRGGVAWACRWNPAPSAAPRGWWPVVGVLVVFTPWCRWAARGSLGRSVGACPSGRLPA
ncbi:STAS domain-containing protein [Micromonospora sp. MP36]|uniref:STAS domain-containing protein n=1 Tax=unclassified Micromonospora TaxID=2617518 RepID=UPI00351BB2B6